MFLRTLFVVAAIAAAPQSAAASTEPCWQRVLTDWTNGGIARSYSASCYADALKRLPTDVRMYSDAGQDIRRAMLAAIRSDSKPPTSGGGTPRGASPPAAAPAVGAVDNTRSLPLPILGAITLALTLAAVGVVSRLRSRRVSGRTRPLQQ